LQQEYVNCESQAKYKSGNSANQRNFQEFALIVQITKAETKNPHIGGKFGKEVFPDDGYIHIAVDEHQSKSQNSLVKLSRLHEGRPSFTGALMTSVR
jgi:hypothetical protein